MVKPLTYTLGGLRLLPCAAGQCLECACKHAPDQPHDAQSLYYQYWFLAKHDRWPTWKDALAHCFPSVRDAWEKALRERGLWKEPVTAGVCSKTVGKKARKVKRKRQGAQKR